MLIAANPGARARRAWRTPSISTSTSAAAQMPTPIPTPTRTSVATPSKATATPSTVIASTVPFCELSPGRMRARRTVGQKRMTVPRTVVPTQPSSMTLTWATSSLSRTGSPADSCATATPSATPMTSQTAAIAENRTSPAKRAASAPRSCIARRPACASPATPTRAAPATTSGGRSPSMPAITRTAPAVCAASLAPMPIRPPGAARRVSASAKCWLQMRIAHVTTPSMTTCTMSQPLCGTKRCAITTTIAATIQAPSTAFITRYQARRPMLRVPGAVLTSRA